MYPGVDLVYSGNQRQLEYDFVVAPGADPGIIRLAFDGLVGAGPRACPQEGDHRGSPLRIDDNGDLILHIACGELRLHKPRIYQEINGIKHEIPGRYVLLETPDSRPQTLDSRLQTHQVGFQVAAYDASKPLIIDPVLSYSTYLGGNGEDKGSSIAVDSSGNAYVTGHTFSANFPTTAGAFQAANRDSFDAFVTKLNATGTTLVYSTYLGGSNSDTSSGIVVDSSGNAYITGHTFSTNFPTMNPFQAAFGGGTLDAFVTKLNATGTALVYSTYLGGNGGDAGFDIAMDSFGNAYITGLTFSTNFPTANPFQAANNGVSNAFVTKLNATGTALVYSTYLGGSNFDEGHGIAVDSSGNAYITGHTRSTDFPVANPLQAASGGGSFDGFVTKLNATGTALVYSTYLGGNGEDRGGAIAVDSSGNAYVTGLTASTDFPVANPLQVTFGGGSFDGFVTKLNATGTALVYSTYLGGSNEDRGGAIAVDSSGNAYVTGATQSTNFPTANPFQAANNGVSNAFVTKLNATGNTLVYSTYLGGSNFDEGQGITVDSFGNAYVTGFTFSTNFPTANPFQAANRGNTDVFVAKIIERESLSVSSTSLAFGGVTVGSTKNLTFTIQNTGTDTLSVTLTSPASPFSIISGGGSFSLAPGATWVVIVLFSPTSAGSFGGVINIISSGGDASVTLSGIGTSPSGPALTACGTALDFGSVLVGSSTDLTCTVTNSGTGTLTGSASTLPPFSIVSGSPFSLGAGQSGTLTLRFTPSSVGAVEGSASVTSNGGNLTINLKGNGTQDPVLAVSPTTLNFGGVRVGRNKDLPLTAQNRGRGTLSLNACAPTPFSVVSGASFSLAEGQSQTFTVRFSPTTTSPFNGTLIFSSTPCSNPQPDPTVVAVSGTGEPEAASGRAYVVNRGDGNVSVIDTKTQKPVPQSPIKVGDQPVALALTPDGSKVYVVNFGSNSNSVSVINTATLQVDKTISVGRLPIAIVITPDGKRAYVANSGPGEDSVSVIDTTTDPPSAPAIPVFRPAPSVLALNPNGTVLYAMGTGSTFVGVVDTNTNQFGRIKAGQGPVAVTFSPDGRRAYIANQDDNSVSIFDTTTFPPAKVGDDVRVGQGPRSLVVSPDGKKVYVANPLDSSFSIINTTTGQVTSAASGLPGYLVDTPEGPLLVHTSTFAPWIVPWTLLIDPRSVGTPTPILLVINRGSATSQAPGSVGFLNMSTDQPDPNTVPTGTNSEQGAFDPEFPQAAVASFSANPGQGASGPGLAQAIVTNFGSDNISFVNTTSKTASSLPVGLAPVAVATALQATNTPPFGFVDIPAPGAAVQGIINVAGWVLDKEDSSLTVQLLVDGSVVSSSPTRFSRPDVCGAFPSVSHCASSNPGVSFSFNTTTVGNGTHTLALRVTDPKGASTTVGPFTVTVNNPN